MPDTGPLIEEQKVVLIGLEAAATRGTIATPTLPLEVFDFRMDPETAYIERRPPSKLGGLAAGARGSKAGTCSFRTELRTAGGVTDVLDPGLAACFQACGFKVAAATLVKETIAASQLTVSIWGNLQGRLMAMLGCAGNVKIEGEAGKPVYCTFDFKGVWSPVAGVALPTVTVPSAAIAQMDAAAFTWDSWPLLCQKFSLDLGCRVAPRYNPASARGGIQHYCVPTRTPVLTVDAEAAPFADRDNYAKFEDGGVGAVSLALVAGAIHNKVTIAVPIAQLRKISAGERDGIATDNLELVALDSTGSDVVLTVS